MFGLGTTELVIILLIVIMIFGVGKLPTVAKQLGVGIRNFQKSVRGEDEEDTNKEAPRPRELEDKSVNLSGDSNIHAETKKSEHPLG